MHIFTNNSCNKRPLTSALVSPLWIVVLAAILDKVCRNQGVQTPGVSTKLMAQRHHSIPLLKSSPCCSHFNCPRCKTTTPACLKTLHALSRRVATQECMADYILEGNMSSNLIWTMSTPYRWIPFESKIESQWHLEGETTLRIGC